MPADICCNALVSSRRRLLEQHLAPDSGAKSEPGGQPVPRPRDLAGCGINELHVRFLCSNSEIPRVQVQARFNWRTVKWETSMQTMTPESKVSLLIAEDDPHIRFFMQTAAVRTGLFGPIATYADGELAWRALSDATSCQHPELIISDLSMPKMTGLDLVRALKADARTRHIPIAIVTSSREPADRSAALAAGAAAFEYKPAGIDAFTRLIAELRHLCGEAAVST